MKTYSYWDAWAVLKLQAGWTVTCSIAGMSGLRLHKLLLSCNQTRRSIRLDGGPQSSTIRRECISA